MRDYQKMEFTPEVVAELKKLYEKKISNSSPSTFQMCWTHALDAVLEIEQLQQHLKTAEKMLVACEAQRDLAQKDADNSKALREILLTARATLRSYQYGNGSPDLAEEVIEHIDKRIAASDAGKRGQA